jgi:penicillin-binding protein 1A
MTVRLAQFLGIKKVIEVTKRFGISDNPPRNFALALGAVETTLLNLTNAYGMIVNGGKRIAPSLIERIQDVNGKTIYKRDKRECEGCLINSTTDVFAIIAPDIEDNRETVTDPRTAYQMVSILQGVVQRGTAASALKLNRTLGGKTGTTNESNDLWFVGFSPDLVVGTFIGYDTPKSLGEKETGATWALPIFIEFMAEALKNTPDIPFRIPPGIKQIKVNAITGKPTDAPLARDVIIESFKSGTEPVPEQATPFAPASPASEPSIFDSFDNFLRESTPSGIY